MPHPLLDHADLLRSGKPTFTAWIGMPELVLPDVLAREDFDSIVLDMQHGMHSVETVLRGISMAALAGKPTIVRVPVGDFTMASRALDFGAMGIIAPMINTVEQAKTLVSFTKYPPVGDRSWGPMRAIPLTGLSMNEYLAQANGRIITLAMIETREAMAALDGILAVDGIDGIFVGPGDLSIALSNGASVNPNGPEVDKALDYIVARTKAAGKLPTAFATSGERAAEMIRRGFVMSTLCTDIMLMQLGARAELKKARGLIGQTGQAGY